MDECEREGGKDENEGWRCRPSGGVLLLLLWADDCGGCALGAMTCIAAKATVSIFSARAPGDD